MVRVKRSSEEIRRLKEVFVTNGVNIVKDIITHTTKDGSLRRQTGRELNHRVDVKNMFFHRRNVSREEEFFNR